MVSSRSFIPIVLATLLAVVNAGKIQDPSIELPSTASTYREQVKSAFSSAYSDYKSKAYGHDDLSPVSGGFVDSRNGWGATIVDAMSTMKIMGLDDIFADAVNFTAHIDFSKSQTDDNVSFFETTIRYLGGMLSAYELGGQKDQILIDQAIKLGDKLAFAWVGNNTIPYNTLNFTTNIPVIESAGIAGAGTLSLEFYTLSKYSKNATYQKLAEKTIRQIATNDAPLPGLPAQGLDVSTGKPTGDYITWGGGSDSYFEYLIKYGRLTNNADPLWVESWTKAVDSSIKYLAKVASVNDLLYLTDYTGGENRYIGSHLACFVGGNWILGGKLLNNQTIVDYGLKLTDACINTYQSTATGIGPEVFAYVGKDGANYTGGPPPSPDDQAFYNEHGFYVYDGYTYYDLRPEVIESNFYAWRATGDIKYQDNAVKALKGILENCKAPLAYAPINDVTVLDSGFIDDTESFFFAEVMKYLYLTFDDPNHISLDEWVFNTEAHPFLAPPELPSYDAPSKTSPHGVFKIIDGALPQISPNPRLPKQLIQVVEQGINGLLGGSLRGLFGRKTVLI